jgi:hypothetical protein
MCVGLISKDTGKSSLWASAFLAALGHMLPYCEYYILAHKQYELSSPFTFYVIIIFLLYSMSGLQRYVGLSVITLVKGVFRMRRKYWAGDKGEVEWDDIWCEVKKGNVDAKERNERKGGGEETEGVTFADVNLNSPKFVVKKLYFFFFFFFFFSIYLFSKKFFSLFPSESPFPVSASLLAAQSTFPSFVQFPLFSSASDPAAADFVALRARRIALIDSVCSDTVGTGVLSMGNKGGLGLRYDRVW